MGIIGTARPEKAMRGQKLPDSTVTRIPRRTKMIAINHTTTFNQVGPAARYALLMPPKRSCHPHPLEEMHTTFPAVGDD